MRHSILIMGRFTFSFLKIYFGLFFIKVLNKEINKKEMETRGTKEIFLDVWIP